MLHVQMKVGVYWSTCMDNILSSSLQPKTKKAKVGGASVSAPTSDEEMIPVSVAIVFNYRGLPLCRW